MSESAGVSSIHTGSSPSVPAARASLGQSSRQSVQREARKRAVDARFAAQHTSNELLLRHFEGEHDDGLLGCEAGVGRHVEREGGFAPCRDGLQQ
ncbi:MAG: hypothetical protein R3A78_16250 [Polyangiales bacterium]